MTVQNQETLRQSVGAPDMTTSVTTAMTMIPRMKEESMRTLPTSNILAVLDCMRYREQCQQKKKAAGERKDLIIPCVCERRDRGSLFGRWS